MDDTQWFRDQFEAHGTAARAAGAKAYLKSDLDFIGVTTPQIRQGAREFAARHPHISVGDLRGVVTSLWGTPWFELKSVAVALLERYDPILTAEEMPLVESLLRTSHTWALVDWLSIKCAGSLVRRFPACMVELPRWAIDEDFWIRRSSLLALLEDLRAGRGHFDLFARLAVPMLSEKEFFIRKAIGWVLREVGKKRPALVHAFLSTHRGQASGLTLREAVKYLPPEMRADLAPPRLSAR